MAVTIRSCLMAGVSAVMATALVVVPSVTPPTPEVATSHPVRLSTAVEPLTTPSADIPSLVDQIRMGIVPSLGAPVPTPDIPGPSPAPNDFAGAIKNTYSAIEPWVRYGFELATYAVGWIPWVGWLAPQIMIFYNFGERIVRSLVFNSADWLWGPLPFGQGLANVAQDSWDALVQLGIDQVNFWLPGLPPLPPLPLAASQTTTLTADSMTAGQQPGSTAAQVLQALRERLGLHLPVRNPADVATAKAHGLIARVEQALANISTDARAIPTAPRRGILLSARSAADGVVVTRGNLRPTAKLFDKAATFGPAGSANHPAVALSKRLRQSPPPSLRQSVAQHRPGGGAAKGRQSALRPTQKKLKQSNN